MIHSVNTHHSCVRISVVICILLGGLLIGSLTARAVQVGNDEVVFEQVRYDFPSPGQSTWYWTVTSGDQPAISHVTFELKLSCLNVDDAGTWTDFDTLNSGDGDPVIGTDPQTGDLTGVKFDEAFSGGESRGYYITVDGNYAQDSITFASKAGASFDTGEVTGPSLTCELVNGGGGSDTDSDGISDTEEGSGDRDGDGIANLEDPDPQGYFYCRDNGKILSGGQISVSGPAPANISKDGSSGEYAFTISQTGTYSIDFTAPPNTSIDTSFRNSQTFDPTGMSNPVVLGPGEDGNTGFLTNQPEPFPTDYFTTFELATGDPKIINNNVPLTGEPCTQATIGGDPPLWGDTLVFPTPERFLGRDLSGDADRRDQVLRIKNVETGRVTNTEIPVSGHHRAVDLYGDTAAFVMQESGLSDPTGLFNLWGSTRTDEGPIGVLDVETGEVKMLDVWGSRPTIHEDIVTISGSTLRYYDLGQDRLVNTGLSGTRPVVWGEWIVYERSIDDVPTLQLYHLPTGGTQSTGIAGAYPAIHEGTVAFTTDESWVERDLNGDGDRHDTVVRAYDIAAGRVVNTGQAGEDPAIYGNRIAFSQGRSIRYHDLSKGRTYATGQQGVEPDIYQDTVTSYVWEGWTGLDASADGDREDPIVQMHQVSDADRALPQSQPTAEPHPKPLSVTRVFSHRQANGIHVSVRGQGIEGVELDVYDLSGQRVARQSSTDTQLTWRLSTDDGQRAANGVYLYVVTASGANGQVERSEVRKLVVLR